MMSQAIEPKEELNLTPEKREGPFIIVGLGNPGRRFEHNRHNVGFMLLNRLAGRLGETFSKVQSKALVARAAFQGERVILIKPQTFMNNSGMPVTSLVNFYKVPLENVLVAYDDVDLPLGTLRIRPSGGSAGQKGMQSIIERLGTEEFPRLRIGTSRPPGKKDAAEYVLQDFPAQELELLEETLDRAAEAVFTFIHDGLEKAMNLFNG
ncbi:MAG: aminoacyl-tRNA hydrolase [Acidobacteriaceae bacterium]